MTEGVELEVGQVKIIVIVKLSKKAGLGLVMRARWCLVECGARWAERE